VYSDLIVVTPPACEPVTVDQARRHCRIDATYDDDLLTGYITAARSIAEAYCNRAFITQTLQWTMANSQPPASAWPFVPSGPIFVLPLWFNWADIGGSWLELPRAPTRGVVSVSMGFWGQYPDTALVADTDYFVDTAMQPGRIRLQNQPTNAQDHVQVQFIAGYGATPAAVPAQIITAILWIVAFLYENRGDTDAVMPKAAAAMLAPFRLVTFG
jgi:hypothetical protein